jgi:predicted metal-dependent phosphotriesterase family hydrolase
VSTVRTVLGDIDARVLGTTLMHEHIICGISDEQTIREDDVVEDLQAYLGCGGRSIVELTNTGMGQRADALERLSNASGVIIVAGTGFYVEKWHPPLVSKSTIAELETFMVHEIEDGIGESAVRAGIIGEIGTSSAAITADEAKVLKAAARAAAIAGAPLSTHTSGGRLGREQIELIKAEGLPLNRVSIGHLDLHPDPAYHTAIAAQGAYIQYDTFGKLQYRSDADRIECLVEMVHRGFERQILLSNDISRSAYLSARGGWGYCHLLQTVVPELERRGVTQGAIGLMLRDNPARFLSFASRASRSA